MPAACEARASEDRHEGTVSLKLVTSWVNHLNYNKRANQGRANWSLCWFNVGFSLAHESLLRAHSVRSESLSLEWFAILIV